MNDETDFRMADVDLASLSTTTIATTRLRLRKRLVGDAAALFADMSDPAFMAWWSREPFTTEDELRARFATQASGRRAWAITRSGDDQAIGFVVVGEKPQGGVSEIGYLLARHAQGNGFAHEAVTAIISQLFDEGQRRVFADCDPENVGSIALLERLGFRLEGRLRAEWHTHTGVRDSLIFGLLPTEWLV